MAAKMVKKVVSSSTLRDSPKNMVSSTALRTMATVEMKVRVRDPNRFKITEMLKPYTALSKYTGNQNADIRMRTKVRRTL